MPDMGKILYIGGFELPDKNAAAQRVIGIAKCLRDIGYHVCFINALKQCTHPPEYKNYFGFNTLEYRREKDSDYLFSASTILSIIIDEAPDIVIAYNYPSIALNRIRLYCQKTGIKCIADVTEWYRVNEGLVIYRIIKNLDSAFRMRYVHKHMDGLITISRFLYDYYNKHVPVVLVPPIIDVSDDKWKLENKIIPDVTSFVYAGSPSTIKERLDLIVKAFCTCKKRNHILLNVVGITKNQFVDMYSWSDNLPNNVKFLGRLSHKETLDIVKKSTWAIIIRENNSVVKSGFPTKLVESISCGTPVLVNSFSNICEYLCEDNSIIINDFEYLNMALCMATEKKVKVNAGIFDYKKYIHVIRDIIV